MTFTTFDEEDDSLLVSAVAEVLRQTHASMFNMVLSIDQHGNRRAAARELVDRIVTPTLKLMAKQERDRLACES